MACTAGWTAVPTEVNRSVCGMDTNSSDEVRIVYWNYLHTVSPSSCSYMNAFDTAKKTGWRPGNETMEGDYNIEIRTITYRPFT